MKKCPFCKAEIEDNARFCLYCMKPLNKKESIPTPQKKNQWWWLFVVGVLVLLLVISLLMARGKSNPPELSASGESSFRTGENGQSSQGTAYTPSEASGTEGTQQSSGTNQIPEQTPNNVTPEPSTGEPTGGTSEEPPDEIIEPETPITTVVYQYRAARAGDDFSAHYSNAGNDMVITGILRQSADGVYDIPAYIDGKKVIAIVATAFSGSNAEVVYVPDTVKTIWNYAFAGCNLTDIYFRGKSLYVESKAFDSTLTIHCSSDCNDRNLRYYKNSAASYGATWKEWDGCL